MARVAGLVLLLRSGLNLPYLQLRLARLTQGRWRRLWVARLHTQLSWFHATVQVIAGLLLHLADLSMGDDALILNRGSALLVALHEVEKPHFRCQVGPNGLSGKC